MDSKYKTVIGIGSAVGLIGLGAALYLGREEPVTQMPEPVSRLVLPTDPVREGPVMYRVKEGDSFWSIVKRELGVTNNDSISYIIKNIQIKNMLTIDRDVMYVDRNGVRWEGQVDGLADLIYPDEEFSDVTREF